MLFQNEQCNKQAMIYLIVSIHLRQLLMLTKASTLKFGEGLGITKEDNNQTFLTKLGIHKSIHPNSRLKNIQQFLFTNNSVLKTASRGEK